MLSARLQSLPEFTHQHRHEHHQAVISVYGGAEVSVDGREGRLDTWRACLVPADVRHEFSGARENQVLVINVDAWHAGADEARHRDFVVINRLFQRPAVVELDTHLQQLVQLSAGEIRRSSGDEGIRNHLATAILLALSERLNQALPDPRAKRPTLDPETLRRFVLEHLSQRITVEDLAGIACLSTSRFHEVFRETMATSPHQFLMNTRLDQACQLLRTTSLTVASISSRTGFSSQSALTTALRKHRGMTPSELRLRTP
ncbi:transcriptional regulator, AraC family [Marinobacter daqiaonensis]|uniref:Transcriptional regulator, AraC family n=1 Tax=Marinobacter daqiaonensis TaxID=650891 RepID=A0A1I6H3V9_9GAMM|nr:AraC family transcriptional regulator [Marinobacter daqiaonensis]SFR49057.1 transcriptional regulator, AraC family [Marinobacter daqiaonensis]